MARVGAPAERVAHGPGTGPGASERLARAAAGAQSAAAMAMLRHLSPAGRCRLLLLVVAALVARALVPAGWMPVASAGGVRLALCHGDGPAAAAMAMPMRHGHGSMPLEHHQGAPDHPCAFAGAVAALGGDWPAAPLPSPRPHARPAPARLLVAIGQGLAAPPPPPTGPPAFA